MHISSDTGKPWNLYGAVTFIPTTVHAMESLVRDRLQWCLNIMDKSSYSWHILSGGGGALVLWQYLRGQLPIPVYGGVLSFSRTLSTIRLQLADMSPQTYISWYKENSMVLIPRFDKWTVLVHSRYIDEISKAPDNQLSFIDASHSMFCARYNFGKWAVEDHYQHEPIKKQLTRNLVVLFPDVFDEVQAAVSELVQCEREESVSRTVFPLVQEVIARASNRVLVGLPYCRDKEWLSLVRTASMDVVKVASIVNIFPTALRPIVGTLISPRERRIARARKVIGPMVEEKLANRGTEFETDDYVSWLISYAPERELNPKDIIGRLLITNFAAIHTTTSNISHALFWLLSRPHYIEPLRDEIQRVTERLGWTKESIGSMPKLDSFMKECMRLTPIGSQALNRIALRQFTFSNGLQVPAGTSISAHSYATHRDNSIYPRADEFDGFRFVPSNGGEEDTNTNDAGDAKSTAFKQTMYTTSPTYISFGHGKHACPGRFFASMELKLIFSYLIHHYDMSWPKDVVDGYQSAEVTANGEKIGYRPADTWINGNILPNQKAKIVFKRRAV